MEPAPSVAFMRQMLESCEKRAGEARRTTSESVGLETLHPGQKHVRPFSLTGWQLERPASSPKPWRAASAPSHAGREVTIAGAAGDGA